MKFRLVMDPVFEGAHILHLPYSYLDRMVRGGVNVFSTCIQHIGNFSHGCLWDI